MERILLKSAELQDLNCGIQNINKRLDEMEDRLFNEIKPKFIPLKKVLKILDISRVTADTWHRQGLLTKHYKGSRVYYLTKDIDNLLPSSN